MRNMVLELVEEAEVLLDHKTTTTRWVLWRHRDTKQLSLALTQEDQVVSINIENFLLFAATILPRFEREICESSRAQQL